MDKFVYAPVNANDIVGHWELYADDKLIDTKPIYAVGSAMVK